MDAHLARESDRDDTTVQDPAQAALQRDPDDWVTGNEPMTQAQAAFLLTLCKDAGESFEEGLTKAEASKRIDELRQRTGRSDTAADRGAGDDAAPPTARHDAAPPTARHDAAPPTARHDAGRSNGRAARTGNAARDVLDEHLRLREAGDVEADIEASYSEDVVLLTPSGPHRGPDGVRLLARILADDLPDATFEYGPPVVEGDFALLQWRARGPRGRVAEGVESYVLRGGKIIARTIHYAPAR